MDELGRKFCVFDFVDVRWEGTSGCLLCGGCKVAKGRRRVGGVRRKGTQERRRRGDRGVVAVESERRRSAEDVNEGGGGMAKAAPGRRGGSSEYVFHGVLDEEDGITVWLSKKVLGGRTR